MRGVTSGLAMAAVCLTLTGATAACTSTVDGNASTQQSVSPTGASSTAVSSASGAPAATVTRTSVPPRTVTVTPRHRAATKAAPAPSSYAALSGLYDRASVVDNADYGTSGGNGVFFDAPSQNIGCYLNDSGVAECAIHDYRFPQAGPDCSAGIGVTLDSGGYPSLTSCSGYFPVANRGGVLPYGAAIEGDDVACVSEPGGVSCLNMDTRTGFTLSKQAFTPVYH